MTNPEGGAARERGISRRRFLEGSGAALALSFVYLDCRPPKAVAAGDESPAEVPEYADFQDVYRQKWTWDRVVRSTHNVNCAYQKSCVWNVYVKDGIVWREEQVGDYPRTNDSVPDFNPRGCQKGACFSARSVAPSRLLHPLKRVGDPAEVAAAARFLLGSDSGFMTGQVLQIDGGISSLKLL